METRKSLILHFDSLDVIDELSNEQIAQLFKAIRDYNLGKDIQLDGLMKAIFIPFKNQFDRDLEKYKKKCEINANNGKKGGRPKETQENPVGYFETQENPKKPYSKNDNNSDNKKDSKNNNKKNNKLIYREFNHLTLYQDEFEKLNVIYSKEVIDDVLDSIENYKDNKKYTSLYLTASKWLKKESIKPTTKPKINFNSLL